MELGKCYRFRAYRNHKSYLALSKHNLIFNSNKAGNKVWKVVKGKWGKGSITLVHPKNPAKAIRHQGYTAKLHAGRSTLWKKDASFLAGRFKFKGFTKNTVSFRSVNYPKYYLAHAPFAKRSAHAGVAIRKFNHRNVRNFAERAAWMYYPAKC